MDRNHQASTGRVVLFASILALAGCGGGGGGDGSPAPNTTPTDSFVVTDTTPLHNSAGVDRTTPGITALFDDAILNTTVATDTIALTNAAGDAVAGTTTLSNVSELSFTPGVVLGPLTTYTATVNNSLANLNGTPLGTDFSWSFTTVDGSWSVPQIMPNGDPTTTGADRRAAIVLPVPGTQDYSAAWCGYNGTVNEFQIFVSKYKAASGWGTPVKVAASKFGGCIFDFTIDSDGTHYLVHEGVKSINPGSFINYTEAFYVVGTPDDNWTTSTEIYFDSEYIASYPRIDAKNGTVMAVWVVSRLVSNGIDDNYIATSRYVNGAWTTPVNVDVNVYNARNPDIAVSGNGDAVVAWQYYHATLLPHGQDIYAAVYDSDNGGWQAAQKIEFDDATSATYPMVAMNNKGKALVAYAKDVTTTHRIDTNVYVNGVWQGTQRLSDIITAPSQLSELYLSVAISDNAEETVLASLKEYRNVIADPVYGDLKGYYPAYRTHENTTGWSDIQLITDRHGDNHYLAPNVAIDESGNAMLTFVYDPNTDNARLYATRLAYNQAPQPSVLVSSATSTNDVLPESNAIQYLGNGRYLTNWLQLDTGEDAIHLNLFQ